MKRKLNGSATPVGTPTMHALHTLDTRLVLSAEAVATSMTANTQINTRWVRSTDTQQHKQKHRWRYPWVTPILLSTTIQVICCFCNRTEVTWIRYTCRHYHYVCSYDGRASCAKCKSGVHPHSSTHPASFPEGAGYWPDCKTVAAASHHSG